MKAPRIGLAVGVVVVSLALVGSPASAARETLVGTGYTTFDGGGDSPCAPNNLQLVLEGAERSAEEWVFNLSAVNTDPLCLVEADFPLLALDLAFAGPWRLEGGCVSVVGAEVLLGDLYMCLIEPEGAGNVITYELHMCGEPQPCGEEDTPGEVQLLHTNLPV